MNQTDDSKLVPFNDLGRGTEALRDVLDAAIERVVSSGWYVMGPEHNQLEVELCDYMGVLNSILVGNGTDALQLALAGLGVVPGDKVMTAANAGGYASTAIRALHGVPVYADVDAASHLLSADTLEAAVASEGSAPKVVVVTHLFGAAADMKTIMPWARNHGIAVVEDCAQSLGSKLDGRRVGSYGDVATTSFYPTKNLGALGDGGAVFTSNKDVASRIRQLRQYGWSSKYRTTVSGGRNSRLDELQAAILRVKLPYLDSWNGRRRNIHSEYEVAAGSGVRFVNTANDAFVGHLAVIETSDREQARAHFDAAGIRTDVHYPIPDHKQPLMSATATRALPVTEGLASRILSVPLFPELRQREIDRVISVLERL